MDSNYTLKVVSVIKETADCVTLCFKQPALKKIKYFPGQYLTVIANINGRRYVRPYSFSSAPGIDDTLNITVKRVPGGVMSNHLIDKVTVNHMMEVLKPQGNFTVEGIESLADSNVVFWGAGSGITPLISIIKYLLGNNLCKHVTLVYGNRDFENVIFLDLINELAEKFDQQFSVWHFHTQAYVDDSNPYIIKGRIDSKKVLQVIGAERDLQKTYHFVCGPVGLKDSVIDVLYEMGISRDKVFSEDFQLVKDPVEFENIITRTVKLIKNGEEVDVEVSKGKSILEAGLDALLDLSYSCQTGSCLLCKGKVLQGQTKTIGIVNLPQELADDECLLCCSFPLTDNIRIAI